ncbi:hypothetical protein K439DRAFT_1631905 [Ramaria rubella]|nr:hypothetical protein K439DRAFT_1631905 [Ramaria rubella]
MMHDRRHNPLLFPRDGGGMVEAGLSSACLLFGSCLEKNLKPCRMVGPRVSYVYFNHTSLSP